MNLLEEEKNNAYMLKENELYESKIPGIKDALEEQKEKFNEQLEEKKKRTSIYL